MNFKMLREKNLKNLPGMNEKRLSVFHKISQKEE